MTQKVSITRRWIGPVPVGQNGNPIPRNQWPRRRAHRWEVRWFAPDEIGRVVRRSQSCETRVEAEAIQAAKQAEFNESPRSRRVAPRITATAFAEEFAALRIGPRGQRLKARSLTEARRVLGKFVESVGADRLLVDIGPADAVRYVESLRSDTLSPASVNRVKRTLKAVLNVAVLRLRYIRENPFADIRADKLGKKPIRYVTVEEFQAILDACEETDNPLWWRTIVFVAYTGGLRFSEACNLVWSDIDFEAGTIQVTTKTDAPGTVAWSPKGYEIRTIPVPAETIDLLARIQSEGPSDHAYVFITPERIAFIKAAQAAGRWSEDRPILNNFHRDYPEIVKRAAEAVPSLAIWTKDAQGRRTPEKATVNLHDLRRTAITNWSKVVNVQTVMELAGHNDVKTTLAYYATSTQDQIEKARSASEGALLAQTDAKLPHPRSLHASTENADSVSS